ncbi:type II toxin-antitoxin system VapC family toxin [Candidatus Curtissbacteria bacterium]|nr:type II toxin-antitoxin system VapC family toxin [Candidatus Curtissbacteria bacterium]
MVVVDTSVAYKWFSPENEEFLYEALALLKNPSALIAPDLIIYELANSWATKTKLKNSQIKIFLKDFEEAEIKIEPVSFELIRRAIDFSRKYHVSVYDATYAMLASEKGCNFVTADSKFVAKVKLPFVKHLSEYSSDIN